MFLAGSVLKFFLKMAICDIKTLSYPTVFDGADLTPADENSKFLLLTQLKGGGGGGLDSERLI